MAMPARRTETTAWDALSRELDAWGEIGLRATFWWRDDDATRPSPRLDRLFRVRGEAPVTLAVIPALLDDRLPAVVEGLTSVRVAQHGFAHHNHAPGGAKKAEYGPHRTLAAMLAEIADGQRRLQLAFGSAVAPVFVPPWNRVDPALGPPLARSGFRAVSAFGGGVMPGIPRIDTHVDLIDWRNGRKFAGERAVLDRIVRLLQERRTAGPSASPAIGLLTHHIDHDEQGWRFLGNLSMFLSNREAAGWAAVDDLLA